MGAAGLRSVATFGDVDGDARQYEGDQLLGTIVLVWLHMVQGRMVRGGGGALSELHSVDLGVETRTQSMRNCARFLVGLGRWSPPPGSTLRVRISTTGLHAQVIIFVLSCRVLEDTTNSP